MRGRRSASLAAAASRCSAFHTGTSSTVAVCSVCVYGLLAMRCARGFAARRACGAMGSKRKTIDSFFTPADSAPKSKVAAHADSPKQPVHPSSPPQPVHPPKPAPTSPRQPLHPVSAPQHPVHPPSAGGASTSARVDEGATSRASDAAMQKRSATSSRSEHAKTPAAPSRSHSSRFVACLCTYRSASRMQALTWHLLM